MKPRINTKVKEFIKINIRENSCSFVVKKKCEGEA